MKTDTRIRGTSRTTAFFCVLTILFILPGIVPSARAGIPVNGEVFIYNVDVRRFSVVWEVDVPSTCTIKVFHDAGGGDEAEGYTCISRTNDSLPAQERGLMQVDVRDLPSDGAMYYIQTVSTEKASGTTHRWPEGGGLLPVKTEPFTFTLPPRNGLMEIIPYSADGIDPADPNKNLICEGVIVFVDAGGNYPVSSDNGGWPQKRFGAYHSVAIDLSGLRSGNDYIDWIDDPEDHAVMVTCLGGRVPGKGLGKRIVQTIYPEELVSYGIDHGWYPCVGEFGIDGPDGCAFLTGNQVIMELTPELLDADGDGYDGTANGGKDCDDADPAVHPGASGNHSGRDNNCNGTIDADERKPSPSFRTFSSYITLLIPPFMQNTNVYGGETLRYSMPWIPLVSPSYPYPNWNFGKQSFLNPFVPPFSLSYAGRFLYPVTSFSSIPTYLRNTNGIGYQAYLPLNWD